MTNDVIAWNSDGWRLHSIDLANVANYAETLPDMPTDAELDEAAERVTENMIRRAVAISGRGREVSDHE